MKALLRKLFSRVHHLANEAKAQAVALFMANQFKPDDGNWVQLSPFGDFGNVDPKGAKVIQRFRKEDAEAICNDFGSIKRKVTQPLGMPFYIGHPDHPRFKNQPGHTDPSAKGRGKEMEVRHADGCPTCISFANTGVPCGDHGLFVKMAWNPDGEKIIANEEFHGHSVNWGAVPVGKEGGVQIFRPVSVKSTGFTNNPAIPVRPASLANEDDETEIANDGPIIPPKLKLIAGFKADDEVTMDQIIAALEKTSIGNAQPLTLALGGGEFAVFIVADAGQDSALANAADQASAAIGFFSWLKSKLVQPYDKLPDSLRYAVNNLLEYQENEEKLKALMGEALANVSAPLPILAVGEIAEIRTNLANERAGRAALLVATAIKEGKVLMADRDATITTLCNAEDFDEAAKQFANVKPKIKVDAKSREIAGKHTVLTADQADRRQKFEGLMAAREQSFPNESYEARFTAVGSSTEGATLLGQMQRPEAEQS